MEKIVDDCKTLKNDEWDLKVTRPFGQIFTSDQTLIELLPLCHRKTVWPHAVMIPTETHPTFYFRSIWPEMEVKIDHFRSCPANLCATSKRKGRVLMIERRVATETNPGTHPRNYYPSILSLVMMPTETKNPDSSFI